ncbi:uncharacterized protein I206_104800 [Kwoniella pini CBS 10737]|uniref:Calpain catalytic domain-containing protein n=1 Tax=Kwoniella pini CBS 10737 TaxID=1296096 RepID=A0A1B9I803_9TREE|nr:uncharacterized protein I206_02339 [Kwoniella pini CBS 10737]OCF51624.1 hypothetical protein I206_02339 [Kwoniella pini CBS 10737]
MTFFLLCLVPLLGLGFTIAPLSTASPVDLGVSATEQIVKRGDHPLWRPQPQYIDIKADKFEDDWLLAGAAALANTDYRKIQDLFSNVTDPKSNVDEVTVKIWNNGEWQKWNKGKEGNGPPSKEHKVVYTDITADYSGANQNWWIAALENAFIQEGGYNGITPNGFAKGDPHIALEMMTGSSAKLYNVNEMSRDTYEKDLWEALGKAQQQPICIKTNDKTDAIALEKKRWYAVLQVQGESHARQVYIWDFKTGLKVAIEYELLADDIGYYVHQEGPN